MATEQNSTPTNGNGSAASTATAAAIIAPPAPEREKLTKKAITADLPFLSLRERTEVRVKI